MSKPATKTPKKTPSKLAAAAKTPKSVKKATGAPTPKKSPGRPKGSVNKAAPTPKKSLGRPKGTGNKVEPPTTTPRKLSTSAVAGTPSPAPRAEPAPTSGWYGLAGLLARVRESLGF